MLFPKFSKRWFNSALVVLSACDPGTGRITNPIDWAAFTLIGEAE